MHVGLSVASALYGWRAIHRYVVQLAGALPSLDPSVDYSLFSWRFRQAALPAALPPPGPQVRHCWTRIPGRALRALWERGLGPAVERFTGDLDLYHVMDAEVPTCRRALRAFTLHGVPHLSAPETFTPAHLREGLARLDRAARACQLFLAVSEHTRGEFLRAYPRLEGRVQVTPLGIDPSFTAIPDPGDASRLTTLGVRAPYLLFVGAVSARKGVDRLLRAHALLWERGFRGLQLVLAGGFPEGERELAVEVEAACAQGRARLTGWLPPTGRELAALYRHGEAFVFPSLSEGWTSPPLEAMACGLPVLTSNLSSLPETVGEAAILFDPADPEAIAGGVARVLEDRELRRGLIERGQDRAAMFTWRRCAELTLAAYRGALG